MRPYLLMNNCPLKTERRLQGWSQARLAKTLGVSTRTVIRWEQGLAMPRPYYRKKLGIIFGKTAQELGLLWNIDENEAVQETRPSVPQLVTPDVSLQVSLPTNASIAQTLDPTNSLVRRASLFMQVKQYLLEADSLTFTALHGLPGVGKTTLAMALAMDQQVQLHFRDGILWAPLGERPDMLGQLMRWGTLLGVVPSNVENPATCESWGQALRSTIGTRQMLLVIDDAWTVEDALALQVGGPQCTYLLTTRQPSLSFTFAEQQATIVPPLGVIDGLTLLAQFVPQLVQQDPEGALSLIQALGCLPLALTLMGNYLASPTLTQFSRPLRAALAHVHETQERLRLSMTTSLEEDGPNLAEMIPLSLYATIAICNQQLSPQAHATLRALAVFPPKPHSFSEEAALMMSQQPKEILATLWNTGLLENWGQGRYSLHQTIVDYVRRAKS